MALQFLTAVFAEWAEQEFQKHQGHDDRMGAIRVFLKALDQSLSTHHPPDLRLYRKPRDLIHLPLPTLRKERLHLVSQLQMLSPDDAMRELAEIVAGWVYAIPENMLERLPFPPSEYDEKTIATELKDWFVIYFSW